MSRTFSIIIFLFTISHLFAQEKFTLSGYVKDASSGEELIGATIYIEELKSGGTTNVYGYYSLTIPKGNYHIRYSYIGFESNTVVIDLSKSQINDLELKVQESTLNEVVIKGEADDANIRSAEMGVVKMDIKEINKIPVLFGEMDIIKTLTLMPGVSSGGEGKGGFYVRGGNTDQNLILLDEAPVYNASHLMGFFSVFNSDAIKDMTLYKAGIPAKFGGRLSSVLDVHMKEGNQKKYSVSGGLGLISSRLTIEGPIVKDKGSFIVSGRRTYADVLFGLFDKDFSDMSLFFYDLNAKANYRIGENDRLFISGYFGKDKLGTEKFGFNWGNTTGTLRWNHLFNSRLFSNTTLIYSSYNYQINITQSNSEFEISSGIEDYHIKQDFTFFANTDNTVKFGMDVIYHTFKPGDLISAGELQIDNIIIDKKHAFESGIYLSNEQKLGSRVKLDYGIRFSLFNEVGPGSVFQYDSDGEIINEKIYNKGELIESYFEPEPRLSMSYLLNESSSLKASFQRNAQYIHLLSASTSDNPTDVWVPSSSLIKPEKANQYSVGYFRNFLNNTFETSIEVYYKDMYDLVDYKDGADILLNEHVEADLVFGKGRSYGVELLLKKNLGKFTGWVGYTLSKTERQFDAINSGDWFSARQDRTNDVSVVGMYDINDRLAVSASWLYYTGDAVTMPSGQYLIDGNIVPLYTERNGYRMPDYHRLDLSLTLKGKQTQKFQSSWNFSIYNAYARQNAYSISFEESETVPGTMEAVQFSLFSIIPSVTWNFKF
ncbi:MAG: carboxypeptidase-like regulatory domain-containing protein [Bacteroidetes bacterium]|nr:carboxypeptidase-like regulatory domain-containing protein [Bacteroidota bacterium]